MFCAPLLNRLRPVSSEMHKHKRITIPRIYMQGKRKICVSFCRNIPNLPDSVPLLPPLRLRKQTEAARSYLTAESSFKGRVSGLSICCSAHGQPTSYSKIASVIKNYKPEVSSSTQLHMSPWVPQRSPCKFPLVPPCFCDWYYRWRA